MTIIETEFVDLSKLKRYWEKLEMRDILSSLTSFLFFQISDFGKWILFLSQCNGNFSFVRKLIYFKIKGELVFF